MYKKAGFSFWDDMSQRLLGALAAILIPLMFGLGLVRNHAMTNDSFTSQTIFKLHFVAKPLSPESVVKSVLNSQNLTIAKTPIRLRAENLFEKKSADTNQTADASASPIASSASVVETDIITTTNHSAEMNVGALAQQFKGKSAINAYQDARSDIQKMADRRSVALHAMRQTKYGLFQTAASNAAVPDCLARGTTTKLGLDSFKGLLAIPALATAAAMGKCK